jgi:hypothetical protein
MARIADKLSPSQISRFLKSTRDVEGLASVVAMLADQEELVLELELAAARVDADWPQTVCDAIEDHAGGQGPGIWRYCVKATNRDGRMCGSTWCRMTVHRGRDADGNEERLLDGSVGSFVQQLQASLEEQNKTNLALTKTVVETLKAQGDMVKTLFERQTALEKERAELIAENLDAAAREAIRTPEKGDGDDPFGAIGKMIAEAAMDKYGPAVLEKLGIRLPGAPVAITGGVDSPNGVQEPPVTGAPQEASQAHAGPNPD